MRGASQVGGAVSSGEAGDFDGPRVVTVRNEEGVSKEGGEHGS